MNISLTPELEKYVLDKVASGRFASASEVIRDMIRRESDNYEKLHQLRYEIQKGLDSLDRGEGIAASEVFANLENLIAQNAQKVQNSQKGDATWI